MLLPHMAQGVHLCFKRKEREQSEEVLDHRLNSSWANCIPQGLSAPHCHTRPHRGILSHLTLSTGNTDSARFSICHSFPPQSSECSQSLNFPTSELHRSRSSHSDSDVQCGSVSAWSRQHADTPVSVGPGSLGVEG